MSKLIAKHRRVASAIVSVSTAILLTGTALVPIASAAGLTEAQIQSILTLLQSFGADQAVVNNVSSALRGQATPGVAVAGKCSFTKDLALGAKDDDVKCLQNYLKGAGHFTADATGYFGSITKGAVSAWQTANGVSPAAGYFGSISRAKYNSMVAAAPAVPAAPAAPGVPAPVVVTPVGSGLTVNAGIQPVSSLFPVNSTRVPFTVLNLTASADGDVVVDSMLIERTGLAQDASFAGVILMDDQGTQLGISKTLNSLHQAILTEDVTVKAGQTKTVVIGGNAQTSGGGYGGQIAYLSVVSVAANTAVNGAFPLTGAAHTVNETLTIGTVPGPARGSLDPGSSQTKEVGVKSYTFSGVKFTAGSAEDVYIKYVRWYQSGSASKDDLKNVKVLANGSEYVPIVSADGKYYTTVFTENAGKGMLMNKGFSREISIKSDIEGGSLRTVDFDIQKRTDIAFQGALYGYGLTPPFGSGTTADAAAFRDKDDPYYDAAQVEISAGTMTVSVNTVLAPAQNIAENLGNQPFGAFTVDVRGEPISVANIHFNFEIEAIGANAEDDVDDLTSISIFDADGKVIAGPVDGVTGETNTNGAAGTATGEVRFADTIVFPAGVHSYILKGKIGTDMDNNDTVQGSTTPSGWGTVRGQLTNSTITPSPTSALTMSQMTVKTGSLTVSVSSIPIAQIVIQGAQQFAFANYILDSTASGEDIRLVSLPVEYNFNGGNAAADLTSCKIYDGSTNVNSQNIKNPTAKGSSTSFVFDGSGLTLAKGTSKTLTLKCNVSASAANNSFFEWGIDDAEDTNFTGATGLTSGQTVVETFTDSVGQRMTVSTGGTMTIALDTNSPGYKVVNSGSAGVELARIRYSAANEDIELRQVALQLSRAASNSPTDLALRRVTLWDADVQVGEAIFPSGDTATSSAITNFVIAKDTAKVLIVKGDIAAISNSGPITASGEYLTVNHDGSNLGTNGNYGVGKASGSNITPTGADTASSGVRVNKAYPTFTKLVPESNTILAGTQSSKELYRFNMKANGGDVAIFKWTFTVSSSTASIGNATTSTYGLYVYTDSAFSIVDSVFTTDGLINYGNCVTGRTDVTNTTAAAGLSNSPLTLEVYPDKGTTACNATTTYTIPSGATRYFSFKATVANVESVAGQETISMRLDGDAAYPEGNSGMTTNLTGNMFTTTDMDTATNDDFIWSPRSTATAVSLQDVDWINGFALPGLPGTYMGIEYFSSPN